MINLRDLFWQNLYDSKTNKKEWFFVRNKNKIYILVLFWINFGSNKNATKHVVVFETVLSINEFEETNLNKCVCV